MLDSGSTIIIGHKNPDTDSICSALGYAALKKAMGEKGVIAARAGNINPQTEFVLRYFKQEPPVYLSDVHPKVRDVMTTDIATASRKTPLCAVINDMGRRNIRYMPVTEEGRPVGVLSLSAVAEHLIVRTPSPTSEVYTSISNVIEALQASAVHLFSADEEFSAAVFVGAMAEESFKDVVQRKCDAKNCIVIVGDREAIQKAAITSCNVRLLIITGGLEVNADISKMAESNGVSVIISPFDSATTAWLTLLSTPVGHMCSAEFLHVSEKATLKEFRPKVKDGIGVVTDSQGVMSGVITHADLLKTSGARLILMDHNELSQAIDGADEAEIVEVVDHHRLGNFHTSTPIRFVNEPVGSTSTLVGERFFRKGIEPEKGIAGLLMSGIISDTVMLKSPTATERDRAMIEWLSGKAGVDPVEYSRELFKAGSGLAGRTPSDIIGTDFKSYEVKGKSFAMGQVEVVGFGDFYDVRESLEKELMKRKEAGGHALAGLLVTDISYGNSLLLAVVDREVEAALGYPAIDSNLYELKGVLSRKKQVAPHILNLFSELYGK